MDAAYLDARSQIAQITAQDTTITRWDASASGSWYSTQVAV